MTKLLTRILETSAFLCTEESSEKGRIVNSHSELWKANKIMDVYEMMGKEYELIDIVRSNSASIWDHGACLKRIALCFRLRRPKIALCFRLSTLSIDVSALSIDSLSRYILIVPVPVYKNKYATKGNSKVIMILFYFLFSASFVIFISSFSNSY